MYLVKTPKFIQGFFSDLKWKIPTTEKCLYLTFDDGPIPEVTPWILDTLLEYDAKASFFCVGENVTKNPHIFKRLKSEGHCIGNHTFNHLNGWNTSNEHYYQNIETCAKHVNSNLFRPPYGKIKPSQAKHLKSKYQIVMWDILSGDFDPDLSRLDCLNNVIHNASNGSIIVFHDSLKAFSKVKFVLPATLNYFRRNGYTFKSLQL